MIFWRATNPNPWNADFPGTARQPVLDVRTVQGAGAVRKVRQTEVCTP